MHPDMMREINRQRTTELRNEVKRARQARAVRRARRGQWGELEQAALDMPRIPDYADEAVHGTIPAQRRPASAGRAVR